MTEPLPAECIDDGAPAKRRLGGPEAAVIIVIVLCAATLTLADRPTGLVLPLLGGAGLVAAGVLAVTSRGQEIRAALLSMLSAPAT